LGLCLWYFEPNFEEYGTSFSGNATRLYSSTSDQNALSYAAPFLTLVGSGGSDSLTFGGPGVYLLQFFLYVSFPVTYITPVDIIDQSSLTDVTTQGTTYNLGTLADGIAVSLAVVNAQDGGTIILPDSSNLLSCYGSGWSNACCYYITVAQLS